MSLDTWKAEFYPVDASAVPAEQAIEHSLRKWRGLRKENLERHGVQFDKFSKKVCESYDSKDCVRVNDTTCALCRHYLRDSKCTICPLSEVLGKRCDAGYPSPYGMMVRRMGSSDPEPMISALEKALAAQQSKAQVTA